MYRKFKTKQDEIRTWKEIDDDKLPALAHHSKAWCPHPLGHYTWNTLGFTSLGMTDWGLWSWYHGKAHWSTLLTPNWHPILPNHWLDECTAIKDYHIPLKGGMSHPRPSQVGLNSDGTSSFGVWMPTAKSMPLMTRMAMMTAKSLMNWRTWWGIYYLVFNSWNA